LFVLNRPVDFLFFLAPTVDQPDCSTTKYFVYNNVPSCVACPLFFKPYKYSDKIESSNILHDDDDDDKHYST